MTKNYLETLNKGQYEAATTIDGPMLVLAGAGAGKTHTMITRVAYMIDQGIPPEQILLLTFTNKAADEMMERAKRYCGEKADKVTACTYHSFCALMLRRYGKAIGLKQDFDILTPSQASDAIGFTKAKKKEDYAIKGFPKNRKVAEIFSASINLNISIEAVIRSESKYEKLSELVVELENLYQDYQQYKESKGLMDYDDLMLNFYKLLTKNERARQYIENMYRYIMVDEYQDTNDLQFEILQELRKNCKNIAVVGDDAQSIYKFRGANVQNIINFPKQYENCKQVDLVENYRSSNQILNLANKSYELHATEGFPKKMHGQFDTEFLPVVIRAEDDRAEDLAILNGIIDLTSRGIKPERICVASRSSRRFFTLEHLLNQAQISYEKRGGSKFLELEEVLDMIAYLRLSSNKLDELSLFRLLQLHPGVGETYSRNICDLVGVVENPIINNKYKNFKFASELRLLHSTLEESRFIPDEEPEAKFKFFQDFYVNLCTRVITEMNTDEGTRTELFEALEVKKESIEALFDIAKQYDTIKKFLDAIILEQTKVENEDVDLSKVVLTTIHSVKGLEFNTVFIMDCVDGIFPRTQPWIEEDNDELQEELRCFYVAITRPEVRLYICAPKRVNNFKGFMDAPLTRFLDGCEDTYIISDEYIPLVWKDEKI